YLSSSDPGDRLLEEARRLVSDTSSIIIPDHPYLLVIHRFWIPGTKCKSGEEIAVICFVWKTSVFPLRLSLPLLFVGNYLCQHRWLAQSAAQIEAGIKADRFYVKHGTNVRTSKRQWRNISRSSIKEYIRRIREALRLAIAQAGLNLDPRDILSS